MTSWHPQFCPNGSAPYKEGAAARGATLKVLGATGGLPDGLREPSGLHPPVATPALDPGTPLSSAPQLQKEQQQGKLPGAAKQAQMALGQNQG